MASDEEVSKDKLPEPSFEKQVEGYIDEIQTENDPVFSHAYHKFMVNLLTVRDKSVKNELMEEVSAQNKVFGEKLISDVNEVIEQQWIRVLREELSSQSLGLNETLKSIAGDIARINERLEITEGEIREEIKRINVLELRAEDKKRRIERLEIEMQILKPEAIKRYSDELHDIRPILINVVSAFKWWKIIIYITLVTSFWLIIHYAFLR
jgi:hypothetical protein